MWESQYPSVQTLDEIPRLILTSSVAQSYEVRLYPDTLNSKLCRQITWSLFSTRSRELCGSARKFVPDNHDISSDLCHSSLGHALSVELWLRATGRNGVVFYNGQMASGRGDFIALNLVDRFLEFRFNLGTGTAIVR